MESPIKQYQILNNNIQYNNGSPNTTSVIVYIICLYKYYMYYDYNCQLSNTITYTTFKYTFDYDFNFYSILYSLISFYTTV
jgi:hypothetical protein